MIVVVSNTDRNIFMWFHMISSPYKEAHLMITVREESFEMTVKIRKQSLDMPLGPCLPICHWQTLTLMATVTGNYGLFSHLLCCMYLTLNFQIVTIFYQRNTNSVPWVSCKLMADFVWLCLDQVRSSPHANIISPSVFQLAQHYLLLSEDKDTELNSRLAVNWLIKAAKQGRKGASRALQRCWIQRKGTFTKNNKL